MKLLKKLIFVILFGLLAAVGVVFWPKIRECCDRWLAEQAGNASGDDHTSPLGNS